MQNLKRLKNQKSRPVRDSNMKRIILVELKDVAKYRLERLRLKKNRSIYFSLPLTTSSKQMKMIEMVKCGGSAPAAFIE